MVYILFILDILYFKVYLMSSYLSYCPPSCPQALRCLGLLLEVNALIRRWLILKLLPEKVAGVGYCRIA